MLNFTAIDFETANSYRGSPCSVGLVRVRDGKAVETRHWLIRPPVDADWFDPWNIAIHGITPQMVSDAPRWRDVLPAIVDFIGTDVVIAHNAGFDTGVVRYACAVDNIEWPEMRFLCTMVLARHALSLPSYRLPYVVESLGSTLEKHHDALADALAVVDVVTGLCALQGTADVEALAASVGVRVGQMSSDTYKGSVVTSVGGAGALVQTDLNPDADPEGYLYGRVVVFTGKLMSMTRQIAWDECSKVGAVAEPDTTKRTNVLVVGDIDPATLRPGSNLTGKARKAFEYQDKGQAIEVMTEDDFVNCLDGKPLGDPDSLADDKEPMGQTAPEVNVPQPFRSIPLADRPQPKPPREPKEPKPLRRANKPTDQLCSIDGCVTTAAFKTRSRDTWCLDHIAEFYHIGGLKPLEPFSHPDDWILAECLSCTVEAHYRLVYVIDKNSWREPVCRACYWRGWASDARASLGAFANLTPTSYDDARAVVEENGFDYLGPLTAPSLDGDPHHTQCRRCRKISAERLGDITFGCTCSPKR